MENFGFMQVLEGFWNKMLYFLRFWKVSDGKLWFYVGFRRFLKWIVVFPKVLKGFWWKTLVLCRFWKVFGLKCCISLGFERFLMEIFGFMQVLEGFGSKMLYLLRFWKVSGGIVWFIKGSGRFECQSVQALPNYSISLSNRCTVNHFGAQGAQTH